MATGAISNPSRRTGRIGDVCVGTSGWHYAHWRGPFYPASLPATRWLSHYAQFFACVEINNSFYRLPDAATLQRWTAQTPPGFRFSLKAPRTLTHRYKLKHCAEPLTHFLERLTVLGDRLDAVLFQLPPRWHCNTARLENFLVQLPGTHRYVFEFRDPSWHNEDIYALLRAHGAAFCVFELGELRTPVLTTADFAYVRLHGPHAAYGGSYDTRRLRRWAAEIARWRRAGQDVLFFFDNDENGYAVKNARRLQELIAEET